MKKVVLTTSLLAIAAAAQAQSSVTLYGRIDNGIQYENGAPQGHKVAAESGDWGCSWFGMQGSEDIGGGTAVIFQLEGQLNTQNGASQGNLFARHATVGLTNENYGTFKLGNLGAGEIQQDSWALDPQLMQRYAISTLTHGRNWPSAANGFEYTTPKFYGLTLKGQYDLSNNTSWNSAAPGQTQGRSGGLEAIYSTGPLELRVIYDELRGADGTFNNLYVASRSIMGGGTYTIGPVKIWATYQHLSAPDATNGSVLDAASIAALPGGVSAPTAADHEFGGVAWQISPAATVTGAVYHTNVNNGNGNATMYTLAATYNLSKRTFLYTEAAYLHNSSTSNIDLGNDGYGPNNYDPTTNTTSGVGLNNPDYGHSMTGVFAGIMTAF